MLDEISGIYARHARGEKLNLTELQAKTGLDLKNEREPYQVVDGVAVIELNGVLAKKANLFMAISGGTSMGIVGQEIKAADADPSVKSILLRIDSPGGTVDGTQELAQIVAGASKPVVAFADGLMASSAYWVGSAADRIVMSSDTTLVGSIGVVAQHTDYSGADAQAGVKRTEIYAGKYKRIASDTAPLSDEGRDYLTAQVDTLYGVFLEAVAKHRGVSVETVHTNMADGRIFIGQEAIAAGLVDGVSTFDALLANMATGALPVITIAAHDAGVASEAVHDEGKTMTLDEIKTAHPEIAAALEQSGYDKGYAEGAAAELARVTAVKAQTLKGHEALIETLMLDGKTSGPEAAALVVAAEKAVGVAVLAALATDSPKPVADAVAPEAAPTLSAEDKAKADWESNEKLRAEFGDNFAAYSAFVAQEAAGNVRIFSKRSA
jgi:signal peptide peptidase SppA